MDPSSYTHIPSQNPPSWRNTSRRPSRSSHSNQAFRLGAISEDGTPTTQPDVPPRAENHTFQRMFYLGFPPKYKAHGENTPEYGEDFHTFNDVKGPKGENFQDLRHNKHVTKRGGWKRLVIIAIVVLIILVGLGVGLGVGLSKRKQDGSSTSPSSSSPSPQNQTFPLGSYSFPTFLSTVLTSCTLIPATWTCFPYTTYNTSSSSPLDSLTTFNWIITPSTPPTTYQISSSTNPFALTFTNTTLHLLDPNTPTEALSFTLPMQKTVIPDTDISGSGSAARCLYNQTTFAAKLYTRKPRSYPPAGNSTGEEGGGNFKPWPYAVDITQSISAASECYPTENGRVVVGQRIELELQRPGGECECRYRNFG